MLAAILSLGGIVLFGSNDTTAQADRREHRRRPKQLRAELIGGIALQLVPDEGRRLLH